jgi:hypothetical protein
MFLTSFAGQRANIYGFAICGLVAVALALATGSVSKADECCRGTTVPNILNNAVDEGVPMFNDGDHYGCYRVYREALCDVLPMLDRRPTLKAAVECAMRKAACQRSACDKAWTLRHAIDLVLESVN